MTDLLGAGAPRNDLVRMAAPEIEVRADADGDGRTLAGYAAVFNENTEINSWEGRFVERIAPGAFSKTLKERGGQVKVLFNHGMDPSIGDKPLGKPSVMSEDERGLYVEVPLARTSYNDDIVELLRTGALDGMSFRFAVVKDDWQEPAKRGGLPVRTIQEVRLMEFGPVTFPAYEATAAGVRSRDEFTLWRSLPDAKREAIRQIISTSGDAEAGTPATSDADEAAAPSHDDEPAPTTRRTPKHARELRARHIRKVIKP